MRLDPVLIGILIMVHFGRAINHDGFVLADTFESMIDIRRDLEQDGHSLQEAILRSAEARMRPVLMTSLAAAIGLLPAAVATGIGAQSQQPLARVVVGGMLTSAALILIVLPVVYRMIHRRGPQEIEGTQQS